MSITLSIFQYTVTPQVLRISYGYGEFLSAVGNRWAIRSAVAGRR